MQSKQNKSETDILFDTAHFKWLKDSSAIAADSVKNLLRGLGVSELPNNLTTHFKKFFLPNNVTPFDASSQVKTQKNSEYKNIHQKRRKTEIDGLKQTKTGENGSRIATKKLSELTQTC